MRRAALPFRTHYGFSDRERLADLHADSDRVVFASPTETCGVVVLETIRGWEREVDALEPLYREAIAAPS